MAVSIPPVIHLAAITSARDRGPLAHFHALARSAAGLLPTTCPRLPAMMPAVSRCCRARHRPRSAAPDRVIAAWTPGVAGRTARFVRPSSHPDRWTRSPAAGTIPAGRRDPADAAGRGLCWLV